MLHNFVKNLKAFIDEMKSIGDDEVEANEWFEFTFNEDLDQQERGSGAMNLKQGSPSTRTYMNFLG